LGARCRAGAAVAVKLRSSLVVCAVLGLAGAAHAQQAKDSNMLPPSPFAGDKDKGQQPQQQKPQEWWHDRLTPPPPPPWDEALSTSGTDVVAPRVAGEHAGPVFPREHMEHAARLRELERRIAQLEHEKHSEPTPWVEWLKPSLLLQPQLIWNFYNAAASPNSQSGLLPPGVGSNDVTATPNGNTTNPDFFRLRRARLKLDFLPSEFARFVIEIEPVPRDPTIPGSATIARQIEAIARFPISHALAFDVGAGSFEVPFGGEWREHHGDRPFIERTYFQQNMFPGDFDLGAHVSMVSRHVDVELAVINGRTFGELDHGGNLDLNRGKDGVLMARMKAGGFEAGLSGYAGLGQLVDAPNLRFKQFGRFAADLDLSFKHHVGRLGVFRAFGEIVYGTNMDRGVLDAGNLPAMPADLTQDVQNRDELGALIRVDQEFGRWLSLGARYDWYSPDVNLSNDGRHTIGVVAALRLLRDVQMWSERIVPRVQVMLEYDHAIDTIRASGPQGSTKEIDSLSLVLQGRL
jgi:hypothetical protein